MYPFLARAYDRFLCRLLARLVRRPQGGVPHPEFVPRHPDAVSWPAALEPELQRHGNSDTFAFRAPSPLAATTPWPQSRELRGRALGPEDSPASAIVLHGAYENEYTYVEKMGRALARAGYRAWIPAAPCHLDRRERAFSGAPLFWSAELTVFGIYQWLAEVHALMCYLRGRGTKRVGIVGFSLGSLAAGLAATLWPSLDFVAVMAPVGHHLHALGSSQVAAGIWPWMRRLSSADQALLDAWAPIHRTPAGAQLLFLLPLFDVLQPLQLQRLWWEAWGRPDYREYRHGHISLVLCRQLYRDLELFAASLAPRSQTSG